MNIFLPDSVANTPKYLDDKRLNKQILECYQIYQVSLGNSIGYSHHPIVEFYKDCYEFLSSYGLACCCEFNYRFGHRHKYHNFFYNEVFNKFYYTDPTSLRCYIEGSKGTPERVEVYADCFKCDPVYQLYRQKLIKKWNEDIKKGRPPKWTKRSYPKFIKFNGEYELI